MSRRRRENRKLGRRDERAVLIRWNAMKLKREEVELEPAFPFERAHHRACCAQGFREPVDMQSFFAPPQPQIEQKDGDAIDVIGMMMRQNQMQMPQPQMQAPRPMQQMQKPMPQMQQPLMGLGRPQINFRPPQMMQGPPGANLPAMMQRPQFAPNQQMMPLRPQTAPINQQIPLGPPPQMMPQTPMPQFDPMALRSRMMAMRQQGF